MAGRAERGGLVEHGPALWRSHSQASQEKEIRTLSGATKLSSPAFGPNGEVDWKTVLLQMAREKNKDVAFNVVITQAGLTILPAQPERNAD